MSTAWLSVMRSSSENITSERCLTLASSDASKFGSLFAISPIFVATTRKCASPSGDTLP